MLTDRERDPVDKRSEGSGVRPLGARPPGWAQGLRKLYDGVVNEPLPDSFDDLLKKLDQADDA